MLTILILAEETIQELELWIADNSYEPEPACCRECRTIQESAEIDILEDRQRAENRFPVG